MTMYPDHPGESIPEKDHTVVDSSAWSDPHDDFCQGCWNVGLTIDGNWFLLRMSLTKMMRHNQMYTNLLSRHLRLSGEV